MTLNIDKIKSKAPTPRFKLLPHFTITAMVSIAAAAILLSILYQVSSRTQILNDAKKHHEEIANLYRNFIWPTHGKYLLTINSNTVAQISDSPLYKSLNDKIQREIDSSRVLKLKIFNNYGLTIYSSDKTQIGQLKQEYTGFKLAKQGIVSSGITSTKPTTTHSQLTNEVNKHVYSNYIPVFDDIDKNEVVAVIELYSDITHLTNASIKTRNRLFLITVFIMLILFSVLIINVKRADKRIKEKERIQDNIYAEAYWQANHDALTGLPNRIYFNTLLSESLSKIDSTRNILALMYIDLDYFKPVNDTHGHQTGDVVLQCVATRICNELPKDAVLARPGGDEFTAFFIIKKENADADVSAYASSILAALTAPFKIDDIECVLSASIGITYCDDTDKNTGALIAEADSAMYDSKRMGRGIAQIYLNNDNIRAA